MSIPGWTSRASKSNQ